MTDPRQRVYDHIRDQLPAAVAEIKRAQTCLVTMHLKPDGDAVGSAVAMMHILDHLGKTATLYNPDGVGNAFAFLDPEHRCRRTVPTDTHFDLCIVLDCATPALLSDDFDARQHADRVLYIDHHKQYYTGADCLLHDQNAAAVGEILYWLARALSVEITPAIAEALYTSVATDTGSFRYRSATPSAFDVAAALVAAGADVWRVTCNVYEKNPVRRIQLLGSVLPTLWLSPCQRIACLHCTATMLAENGCTRLDTDGFINYARSIDGVEVAAFLTEVKPTQYRVSFRSRGNVDVSMLAVKFGGGGHVNAAACTLTGMSLEAIHDALLAALESLA